ncbi:MAG: DUF1559 domain-containing protein [Zavarzinella sp.]|nr:DUF1559 domain-containing protein [Zavarzinella sp.]
MRRLNWCVPASLTALVLALPAVPAPAPKREDKPDGPVTPAQQKTSVENLKQIGLAMHNYHDTFSTFPTNFQTKGGKPGLSWRVAILPALEEDELYKQFKLDEPWDSEHNAKLIDKMPKLYAPVRGKADKGQTFYQMLAGKHSFLGPPGEGVSMAQVTDGLSNTLMVVEGGKAVTWTKPDDMPYDGKDVPKLGGMFDGKFHAVMGDGSVHRFKKGVPAETLHRLIDRADGHPVDPDAAVDPDTDKD